MWRPAAGQTKLSAAYVSLVSNPNRIAGGQPDGGQFATGDPRPPGPLNAIVPPIGKIIVGEHRMLTPQMVTRIHLINARMEWLPQISVFKETGNNVDLLYTPGEQFDPRCILVNLDADGTVTGGSHGEDWMFNDDIDHPVLQELLIEYGRQ
jgi:hypothetical protein